MKYLRPSLFAVGLLATQAQAEPILPKFDPADFVAGAAIDNPYLPFPPGFQSATYGVSRDDEGDLVEERTKTSYVGPGPEIAGVATVIMQDEAFRGKLNVEQTKDYYAQDRAGNVWYLGEDVLNIHFDDEDKVTGTDTKGSWRAGVNEALPGYAMPAGPVPGLAYEQEHAPADKALDRAEIVAVDGTLDIGGHSYTQVVSVYETSAAEPDLREMKYYAPGVGLIREEEAVDLNRANPEAHFDLVPNGQ